MQEIIIKPSMLVVVNDSLYKDFSVETFDIDEGNILFIDNNGDGEYDVALINAFNNVIVGGVDENNNKIFDKYDMSYNIDLLINIMDWSIADTDGNPVLL